LIRAEWRRSRQGKKVADGRCGRTIEAQPLSDQTCHIEDVVAAPVFDQTGWVSGMAGRDRNISPRAIANAITGRAARSALPCPGSPRSSASPLASHAPAPDHVGGRVVAGGGSLLGMAGLDDLPQLRRCGVHRPSTDPRPGWSKGVMAASFVGPLVAGLVTSCSPQGEAIPQLLPVR